LGRGFRALSDIYIGGQARRFRRLPLAKSAAIRRRALAKPSSLQLDRDLA